MVHRLILKVNKFQLPPAKRLGTVVKNILGDHHAPPMSNRVKVTLSVVLLLVDFLTFDIPVTELKGAGRSAELKISKSASLSLNHHNFSNTELIYTK